MSVDLTRPPASSRTRELLLLSLAPDMEQPVVTSQDVCRAFLSSVQELARKADVEEEGEWVRKD